MISSENSQIQQNNFNYNNYNNTFDKKQSLTNESISPFDINSRKFKSFSLGKSDSYISPNLKIYMESQKKFRFILPIINNSEIANVKMRELVQTFRNELLVYDLEKLNGIILNLPDIIQCGMFGICGIAKNKIELMKILEKCVNLIKEIIRVSNKDNKSFSKSYEKKTDLIDVKDIIGRLKFYIKNDI
jgi:hypothetical protein